VSETAVFSYTRKGFAPDQVDAEYAAVSEELERVKQSNHDASASVAQLKREITDARAKMRKAGNQISFTNLGADLAETLKVAQDRAVDLVRNAEQDTTGLLAATEIECKEVIESARKLAESMVAEAQREAQQLLVQTQKHSEASLLEAEDLLQIAKSKAEVSGTQIVAVEKETQSRLGKIANDTELDRINSERALENLKQEVEIEITQLVNELESSRTASAEAMKIADEATNSYIRDKAAESVLVAEEAERKYADIVMAAEAQSSRLLVEGDNIMRDAKKLSEHLKTSVQTRIRVIKGKVAESARDLNAAALREVTELSRRNQELNAFNADLQMISEAATNANSNFARRS
jgi:cell division septum initiation protein DivIVA